MQGTIFNIQRYSVNDGPGIRTLIFFKGCPLQCVWCSNPESQQRRHQIMYFENLCSRCGTCAAACPNGCITIEDGRRLYDASACERCGRCAAVCPNSAVKRVGREMTVAEVTAEAEKDYLFFLNSGGGVTLGGGEPTLQPDFARALLKSLKALGIHTAMETCGDAPWSVFERLTTHLDLLLYDVKHLDENLHRQHTGKSNGRILSNLKTLLREETPLIVRIPVIPDFNDSVDTMAAIAAFLKRHNQCDLLQRIDLLPYHKLGVGKYGALGRDYALEGYETPPEAVMDALKKPFIDRGFETLVEYL